jgi:hypothetical protein
MIVTYGRPGEQPIVPIEQRPETTPEMYMRAPIVNPEIIDAALKTQVQDKCFDGFIRHFKPADPVATILSVLLGEYHEHGWAVYMRPNTHRCVLSRCTYGRRYEEVVWEAPNVWPKFGTEPRQPERILISPSLPSRG